MVVVDNLLNILMRFAPLKERPAGTKLRKVSGAINAMLDSHTGMRLAATAEVPVRPVFPARIEAHLDHVGFESEVEFMAP